MMILSSGYACLINNELIHYRYDHLSTLNEQYLVLQSSLLEDYMPVTCASPPFC